jgi:hypothetical protein
MFSDRVPRELGINRLARSLNEERDRGRPIIDLTVSNPTQAGIEYPAGLLAPLADARGLLYSPLPFGSLEARAAAAGEYARRGLSVPPDRMVLTASTSEAYSLLFKVLADAGDEVLVPRPSYPLFDHLTRLDLVAPRSYDLEYHGTWSIDFASVERALTARTRAVLVVSPNNPTGSFIRRDELDQLAAICHDRDIAIIGDEVFADYEWSPGAADRAVSVASRTDVLAFSLGGLSKSVGLPQLKLGWIAAAGPAALVGAALDRLELVCDTYLSVSTPVQLAAADLLARGAVVRERIAARVRANHALLLERVTAAPSCRVLQAEGGWYAVIQVPSLQPEEDLVIDLVTSDGVLAHPGYFFDFSHESFLVVSLLTPEAAFGEGVSRLLRRFDSRSGMAVRNGYPA